MAQLSINLNDFYMLLPSTSSHINLRIIANRQRWLNQKNSISSRNDKLKCQWRMKCPNPLYHQRMKTNFKFHSLSSNFIPVIIEFLSLTHSLTHRVCARMKNWLLIKIAENCIILLKNDISLSIIHSFIAIIAIRLQLLLLLAAYYY